MENQNSIRESEINTISSGGLKEMVMIQLNRTILAGNKEMRGGFYLTIVGKTGEEKEHYVEDSREVFSHHVARLRDVLIRRFKDNKIKEKLKNFDEELEKVKKEFIKASSPNEEVILGEKFYEENNDKILLWTYREKKLKIFEDMFQEICYFLDEKNYLTMMGGRG